MKLINGYWTDSRNNRWYSEVWTEGEAEAAAKTLVDCRNCRNCHDCQNCQDCRNCVNCRNCRDCKDYTSNPMRYITAKIGSRKDQTAFYYGQTKSGTSLQVVCGCFRGDLEAFEIKVYKTHGDNEYARQYYKEIGKVRALFGLEEPQ